MTKIGNLTGVGVLGLCLTLVASCTATYRTHGYFPDGTDLENVVVGVDTQATLEDTIGQPGTTGVLQDGDWYYVRSEWRHFAWKTPEEISREVLAIRFDGEGVVENIERFGIRDGRIVVLSRRVTDSNLRSIGFLRQLLGNIGVISADQLFGN